MASLGSLVVSLSANTTQFTSAMEKAAYQAQQRMEQMKRNASMAGKAIGAAFVAGAGAAAYLVKQSINAADEMTKMAQKAGVSIETFSTLAYAANLSGVEVGSLQSAMSKLSTTLMDVVRGTNKDAVDAFDALGISVTDAEGKLKGSDQIMSEVASRFADMENGAGKTAIAIKIFGRSGADLIPLLNSGASGLAEMQEEARALGVELDGKTGSSAERFNDNLSRLNTVKEGFANQIMKAVLPSLERLTDGMVASAKSTGGLENAARVAASGMKIMMSAGALVVGVFKTLGEYLGGVAAIWVKLFQGEFRAALEVGKSVFADFAGNLKNTAATVSSIWDETANQVESNAATNATKLAAPLIDAAEKTSKSREKIEREAHKVRDAVEALIDGLDLQADTFGKSDKAIRLYRASLMGADAAQLAHISSVMDFIESKQKEIEVIEEGARVFEATRTPAENLAAEYEHLSVLLQQGAIDWDTYNRAVAQAQDNFDKVSKTGSTTMEDLQKASAGWGKQFTDTFVDGVMKGKLSFNELADSVVADIMRIIVQKQVLNAFGDIGGEGKAGSGILGFVGNFLGFGGGKALGGDVTAGTSYLVGERGPERFVPQTEGKIIPNEQLASSQGRTIVVNNHFNFSAPQDRRTQTQIAAAAYRGVQAASSRNN